MFGSEGKRRQREEERMQRAPLLLPSPRRDRSPSRSRGGEKEEQEMTLIRRMNSKHTLHESKTYSA